MLIEIMCDEFKDHGNPRGRISFKPGLNTALGSDSGSVGKSTFLTIIGSIFGGDDSVERLRRVRNEVSNRRICFAFKFGDKTYHFSRSNLDHGDVQQCDADYRPLRGTSRKGDGLMAPWQYLSFLASNYKMEMREDPRFLIRNLNARFMRISGQRTLSADCALFNEDETDPKLVMTLKIQDLLKLTGTFISNSDDSRRMERQRYQYKIFMKAQDSGYIPSAVREDIYVKNEKHIAELTRQKEKLAQKSSLGLVDLDSERKEALYSLRNKLPALYRQRVRIQSQLRAIEGDWGSEDNFESSLAALRSFFPNVDIRRIRDVEQFHEWLSGILQKEFSQSEGILSSMLELINEEISQLENEISQTEKETDPIKVVLDRYAALDNEIKTLVVKNKNYRISSELLKTLEEYEKNKDAAERKQIAAMTQMINDKMSEINSEIFGISKDAPQLKIPDSSHYEFSTPGDDIRGAAIFDLALLSITHFPVAIHDSELLDQFKGKELAKLLELYSRTDKQIFIAIDGKKSFTKKARKIIDETTVLRLGTGESALFGRTW